MAQRHRDHLPEDFSERSLSEDVRSGLTSSPKTLPPKWFYDKVGSELYEEITRLPEYYPFAVEREILMARAPEIVSAAGSHHLIELGSGSSEKTRALIEAVLASTPDGEQAAYRAIDVSESALRAAAEDLALRYPALELESVRADFEHGLAEALAVDEGDRTGGRLVIFLGGTIGNQNPQQRQRFLATLHGALEPGDAFLLGADLVKSPDVLVPAYDDAAGVTAAFNLNVLEVVNGRLGADFDPRDFRHVAVWDAENAWIEMRLEAVRDVHVRIADLDLEVDFAAGEQLRTEISAKFTRERLAAEFEAAGFDAAGWWTDDAGRFSVSLWTVAARALT
ncbi:dimethylhistidine N-methyltransferase [Phycicoccus sp. Root563]|uniref:L-histidine N(alpha)-methyltransferase n=1 Tax=Phycicoccus sp. Root563 TaxID=1736562 RepID=UPI000703939B|nr:L-histidine N(alpha)-methyltransferase [Phycicoccus sp. Root563]KQZ89915.1 dimethylhistidine N-methyltransferase [Phycicoccus sp. Root563]